MPATHPTPRRPLSGRARFLLTYQMYGWQILTGLLVILFCGAVFAGSTAYYGRYYGRRPTKASSHPAGFAETDAAIFQSEMLYAAAHHYARDHEGHLPTASTWQAALRPYLAQAGAAGILEPSPSAAGRYVMNRALSGGSLDFASDPSHTLVFWEARTGQSDLPPTAYQNAPGPFLGVTCDGTPVYAVPTGKPNEPPFLRRAQYSRPRK